MLGPLHPCAQRHFTTLMVCVFTNEGSSTAARRQRRQKSRMVQACSEDGKSVSVRLWPFRIRSLNIPIRDFLLSALRLRHIGGPPHILDQLSPGHGSPSGMLLGHFVPSLVRGAREQLERDVARVAGLTDGLEDLQGREIAAVFKGEESGIARPRHARFLLGDEPRVARNEGTVEALAVTDFDVKDLLDGEGEFGAQFGDGLFRVFVGRRGEARRRRRVREDAPGQVERVDAGAEIGSVDFAHDRPRGVPRVDVRAPAEAFVREPCRWGALQSDVRHLSQVGDDTCPGAGAF